MKKEHGSESFGVVWLIILLMALANTFTAFAQVKQATVLVMVFLVIWNKAY